MARHPPSEVPQAAKPPGGGRGRPECPGLARGPSRFIPLGLPVQTRGPGLREVVQECSAHRGLLGVVAKVLSGCLPGAGGIASPSISPGNAATLRRKTAEAFKNNVW